MEEKGSVSRKSEERRDKCHRDSGESDNVSLTESERESADRHIEMSGPANRPREAF